MMRRMLLSAASVGPRLIGYATQSGTSITFPGLIQNDVVVYLGALTVSDGTVSNPTGYTSIVGQSIGNLSRRLSIKQMGVVPDTSLGGRDSLAAGMCLFFRGVTTTADGTTDSTTNYDPPEITTAVARSLIIATIFGATAIVATTAGPSGFQYVGIHHNTGSSGAIVAAAYRVQFSPGAVNPSAFNGSTGDGRSTIMARQAA